MFANALLECAPNLQARRRWILLLSLALQMSAVSLALFYPLLHPEHLPFISTVPKIALLTTPYTQIVSSAGDIVRSTPISRLEWPREINVIRHSDRSARPRAEETDLQPGAPNLPLGVGSDSSVPYVIGNILNTKGPTVVRSAPANTRPLRVSILEEGRLLQKTQPIYPVPAKVAHIQGEVVLTALIARDGSVEGLRAVSGHPMLIPAAIQAVSQWRYKPYILNGSATEVETTIRVNFKLEQ
jgi:periplasmic protein TonB